MAPSFHLRLSLPWVIMDMLNIPATNKIGVIMNRKAISDAHEAKKSMAKIAKNNTLRVRAEN